MDSVVVSVRVKKNIKTELEKEGIDVEGAVKEFLATRAAQLELKKTVGKIHKLIEKEVKPSKKGFAVSSVREDRNVTH